MKDIKLVALDLDGTLFDNSSRISKRNLTAIRSITDKGIHVVISTGRPFEGIPFDQIKGTGINYAITANGSGIYEISTGKCLYENAMDEELVTPILNFLLTRDIHMDAFIGGKGYTPVQCVETAQKLTVPSSIKNYIITTRTRLDNILQFIHENQLKVQKMTLNFYPAADGTLIDRETVRKFLVSNPSITTVCGGYNNLEFTRADANKGVGLRKLAEILGVNPDATMAIGDTEMILPSLRLPVSVWQWEMPLMPSKPGQITSPQRIPRTGWQRPSNILSCNFTHRATTRYFSLKMQ